eukprot:4684061-Alexandrium_andersonii.AAC.1
MGAGRMRAVARWLQLGRTLLADRSQSLGFSGSAWPLRLHLKGRAPQGLPADGGRRGHVWGQRVPPEFLWVVGAHISQ